MIVTPTTLNEYGFGQIFAMTPSELPGGLNGNHLYNYEKNVSINDVFGTHQDFTINNGVDSQTVHCTVVIGTPSTLNPGQMGIQVTTSNCDKEGFLITDPLTFTCDVKVSP